MMRALLAVASLRTDRQPGRAEPPTKKGHRSDPFPFLRR